MAASIRKTAVNILLNVEKKNAYINMEMNKLRNDERMQPRDIRLVGELVNGVIKTKLCLDHIISLHSNVKINKISPYVLNVLRLGIYQLLFMDKIPKSAAVNESVELVKKSSVSRLSGFVNAILRKVSIADLNSLPLDKIEALSIKYSYPLPLTKRWCTSFGTDRAESIMAALNKKSPLHIRCSPLNTTPSDFENILKCADLDYEHVVIDEFSDFNYSFSIKSVKDITVIPGFHEGLFYIQDPTAALAAYLVEPKPDDRVIDLCASPGGKSLFLAELMEDKGEVISCDIYEHKLKLIADNAKKYSVSSIKPVINDASRLRDEWINTADKVLCDVPCSGYGIIRKKPDIKYAHSDEDIKNLASLSYSILENAAAYLKSGGTLVFSTCTIESEENEEVVHRFMDKHPEFSPYPFGDAGGYMYTAYPDITDTDGFFICRLRKNGVTKL